MVSVLSTCLHVLICIKNVKMLICFGNYIQELLRRQPLVASFITKHYGVNATIRLQEARCGTRNQSAAHRHDHTHTIYTSGIVGIHVFHPQPPGSLPHRESGSG